jgi:hypothetical protein
MAARYDPDSAQRYQRGDEFKGSQQPESGGMDMRQGYQQHDEQDNNPTSARQLDAGTGAGRKENPQDYRHGGVISARNDPESERRYEEAHQREMSPTLDPNRAERRGDHHTLGGVGSARNDPESQRRYDEAHQREMSPASDPNRAERGEAGGSGGRGNARGGGNTGDSFQDVTKKVNSNEHAAYGMTVFLITVGGNERSKWGRGNQK